YATGADEKRTTCQSSTTGCETSASDDGAPRGQACPDRGTRPKLRSTRHDAIGNAWPKDAEAEERKRPKHNRHGVVDRRLIAAKTGRELREQCGADSDNDGQYENLDTRRNHVAKDALGGKGSLAEQPERDQHEASERRQLELDERNEELDGQNKEGQQHYDPSKQQNRDLDEILEKADIAHQARDGIEDRSPRIKPDLGNLSGSQEIGRGQAGTRGFQPQAGK